jgi:hypothetical protein
MTDIIINCEGIRLVKSVRQENVSKLLFKLLQGITPAECVKQAMFHGWYPCSEGVQAAFELLYDTRHGWIIKAGR